MCLLERYSAVYASNQFRALQQFFKWLAAKDEIPDPMAGLRPPRVPDQPVPVFDGDDLARLERACAGRSFQRHLPGHRPPRPRVRHRGFPHRFRHHFSHTWLDRGGAEGDLMELNGWTSPQMLRRYGASARSARARRSYDRIMDDAPLPEPDEGRRSRHPAQAKNPPLSRARIRVSLL